MLAPDRSTEFQPVLERLKLHFINNGVNLAKFQKLPSDNVK